MTFSIALILFIALDRRGNLTILITLTHEHKMSFHIYLYLQFLPPMSYIFQCTDIYAYSFKIIPKYSFLCYCKWNHLLNFFPERLLVYRSTLIFYMLIFYTESLLTLFICLNHILVDGLGFLYMRLCHMQR
jgi:hypothetical protein